MAMFGGVPKPIPPPEPRRIASGVTLVTPLSRRGSGPGLIILVPDIASGVSIENGVPSPLMKWAEEGYCVVEVLENAWQSGPDPVVAAVEAIQRCESCDPSCTVGLVCEYRIPLV